MTWLDNTREKPEADSRLLGRKKRQKRARAAGNQNRADVPRVSANEPLEVACPSQYNESCDVFLEAGFVCSFAVIVKDFLCDGLPVPAQNASGVLRGVSRDSDVLRLATNDNCSSIVSRYFDRGTGATFEFPSDGIFVWRGNFLLIRPGGQKSFDPRIPDGMPSLFLLNGRITFNTTDFIVIRYTGKNPVDVCAALS
jgi:hypothetical protein